MAYVIYNKETTLFMPEPNSRHWGHHTRKTEAAAKGALTHAVNDGRVKNRDDYAIAEYKDFKENIEQKVVKNNIHGREMAPISVNTPACCDPSTETYWSM